MPHQATTPLFKTPPPSSPESMEQSIAKDTSLTPLVHQGAGGSGLTPRRNLSLMLSPGVLTSYLLSNTPPSFSTTPLSLARSTERDSMFTRVAEDPLHEVKMGIEIF